MKKRYLAFFTIILLFLTLTLQANGINNSKKVYVVPIKGEIGPAVDEYIKNSILNIKQDPDAVAIIFEIDTYGGRIDSAVKISRNMMNLNLPTIAFINTKAVSAGVLLSISTDTIVMAPSSTIGSAETIPNTEKILSEWISSLRSVAEEKGYSTEIVAAMADKSIEIPGVIQKDRLLNLTSKEAKELDFIDFIETDYNNILQKAAIDYDEITEIPIPTSVKLAQHMTSVYMTSVLLTLGFVGLIVEVLTPGFGIGGTVSFVAFALYFGGAILAGNTGWAVLIVFLVGITLLLIEAFIPGFGIPGIGGIISIIISIFMASNNINIALTSLLITFILTITALILLLKFAPRNKHFNRIVLRTQIKNKDAYKNDNKDIKYLGKSGIAISMLRPIGKIDIDGEILEAISEGTYIEVESKVEVVKIEGSKIIVKKID